MPSISPEAILKIVAYPIYPAAPVTETVMGALLNINLEVENNEFKIGLFLNSLPNILIMT